jgi:hypothetical protein
LVKAPEGWRTPKRFAPFASRRRTRQRPGVRRPFSAFLSTIPQKTDPAISLINAILILLRFP